MDDNSPTLLPCSSGRLLPPMPLPPHLRQAADGDMPTLDHLAREINVRLQRAALMFAFKRPGVLFRSAAADGAGRRMRRAGDRT